MDGWQHSQIVFSGDSYNITLRDHVLPASFENAPYSRLPGALRSSSHAMARCPSASAAIACRPSRAAFGLSLTTAGALQVRAPSLDRHTIRSPDSLAIALTRMVFP